MCVLKMWKKQFLNTCDFYRLTKHWSLDCVVVFLKPKTQQPYETSPGEGESAKKKKKKTPKVFFIITLEQFGFQISNFITFPTIL